MGRSLFFKLLGAFALVIIVLAVVATVLANQAAADAFQMYTNRNGQALAQQLAPALADYYAQNKTWDGVIRLLQGSSSGAAPSNQTPIIPLNTPIPQITQAQGASLPTVAPYLLPPTSQPGGNMGRGMGRGGMMGMGKGMAPTPTISALPQNQGVTGTGENQADQTIYGGMGPRMRGWQGMGTSMNTDTWSMMGHRVIVADSTGRVISDSAGQPVGTTLNPEQLANGQTIQVSGQPAGTVLVAAEDTSPGTPAGEFLRAMNRSILVAVAAAGTVALLLGGILFFQITAPLRKLKVAANAIAAGDLSQRVEVKSRDELGNLGSVFNHMAESLGRMESQRQQMCADVAHELRTPLSVMQANLEAMQDGLLPLDTDEIASLHEETLLLSRLVSDLHLLSLAEAGQLKLERVEVEPCEMIQKSAERLIQNAQDRGVEIRIEGPAELPTIWADADRIRQVIGNLIANALRYTTPGGFVAVSVKELKKSLVGKPSLSENTPRQNKELLISVTDTGCGIPEAELPQIFERFYRADKSRSRTSGGSGLGLAIVKHIVEAHGGRVWAESPVWKAGEKQGPGTRISFTLPITNDVE